MADNVTLDPGTGGSVVRTKDRTGVETSIVALDINPSGSEVLQAAAALADATANPTTAPWAGMLMCFNGTTWDRLRGDTTNGIFANVKTSVLPTGASTSAKQPALGTAGSASADVISIQGVASMTAVKTDGSGVTQPVSGTVTANLGTAAVTNAGTFAVQDSQKVADNAGFTDGTTPVQPAGYIFDEVAGTALTENDAGAARIDSKRAQVLVIEDATTRGQRATVTASNAVKVDGSAVTQPVSGTVTANAGSGPFPVSDNSGSLTVDAPVGTPLFSTVTPSTTGGWSKITALAQTTTKKVVKASAGTFGGYYVYNPNASVAYIQVFDVASGSVTLGTTAPDLVFGIPATSAANLEITNGINMATAITLACTTTATGSTAPGTGLDITTLFK
jgi:hypothetical protein